VSRKVRGRGVNQKEALHAGSAPSNNQSNPILAQLRNNDVKEKKRGTLRATHGEKGASKNSEGITET
jgi:hypothetical protein